MIPKIIHYCWFGRGEKPDIFQKCYDSWRKFAPDYEIVEWNENNFDISHYPFAKQAYDCKKYAFTSDVARLAAVYQCGGIYLDTDVELIAPLDSFLNDSSFLFFSNVIHINTGLGFGAQAGNDLIGKLLQDYKTKTFSIETMNTVSCPILNTAAIKQTLPNFRINNTTQIIGDVHFYDTNTYGQIAVHHDQFSWRNAEHDKALQYARKKRPNQTVMNKLRSPKIFDWFDRHGAKTAKQLYLFLVYDFVEYGPIYWTYKIIHYPGKKLRKNRIGSK